MGAASQRHDVGPGAAAEASAREPRRARAGRRAVRAVVALGGVALIAVAVVGGWGSFHGWVRAKAPPMTVTAPTGQPITASVVEVEGVLERRVGDDAWVTVAPGDRLQAEDAIRTTAGGHAVLAIGDASRIDVTERTELSVREITAAVHRLRLARGRITLEHQADGARVLVVESERGDAVARTNGARFSILSTGAALSVATESGVVRLESGGAKVDIAAGQQSMAVSGAAPSRVAPIPVDVLLRVGAAAAPRDPRLCAVVQGRAEPGSEVLVDGRPVDVEPDGRFEARVPRARGKEHVRVITRDVAGRTVQRTVPCAAPPGAEVTDFAVRWHDGAKARAAR